MTAILEQRPYGRTGQQTTVIGLGGARLASQSFADGVATARRALELGVTYFDTSPMYGKGASQAILGEALEGRPEPHLLATKLGYLASPAAFRSPEALRAQHWENLRLLRRDSVDVLQVHEADQHHWWSDDTRQQGRLRPEAEYDFATAPVMQVLQEEQAQGRCRLIGITGNYPAPLARILQHVEVDVCLSASNYDPIWRGTRHQLLQVAQDQGIAVILGGVFQAGRLLAVPFDWQQASPTWLTPEVRSRVERLHALQQESGLSLVTLILRFLVADPVLSTVLVGAAVPAEIEESVAAIRAGPLPADLHQAIETLGLPAQQASRA